MIHNPVTIPLSQADRQRRLIWKTRQLYLAYILTQAYELDELEVLLEILRNSPRITVIGGSKMIDKLKSIAITVKYGYSGNNEYGWWATVSFFKGEHCVKGYVEGELHLRYADDLSKAIDTIKSEAEALGVEFVHVGNEPPHLFYLNDGEDSDYPPPNDWRVLLKAEADRIGFVSYPWDDVGE